MTCVLMVVMQSGQDWCKVVFSCPPFAPFPLTLSLTACRAKLPPTLESRTMVKTPKPDPMGDGSLVEPCWGLGPSVGSFWVETQ
jgi:hypothetical protein